MNRLICLLVFSFGFVAYAQVNEQSVVERWEKQSPKNLMLLDAADAVTAFYKRKDPVFTAATFLALSCAEQDGQDSLLQTTDVLMSATARLSLEQNIGAIQGQQMAAEFEARQEAAVQKFFRSQLERVGNSQTAADCFNVRARTRP